MDYKVELDVYCGPLDLLLHLIRREELTIEAIPVARVADQFVRYLERLGVIDLDVAGDYIVMAARLTELKSKALLPRIPDEDEELDEDVLSDESDLIQRLLEYRVFKDLAKLLRRRAEVRGRIFPRSMFPDVGDTSAEETLEDLLGNVTALDLFSAFQRIGREVLLEESRTVIYDEIPIENHILRLLEHLEKEGLLAFSRLLPPGARKAYVIGAFLALLELIKRKRIDVDQEEDFGEIRIQQKPPEEAAAAAAGAAPAAPADGSATEPEAEAAGDLPGPENPCEPAAAERTGPVEASPEPEGRKGPEGASEPEDSSPGDRGDEPHAEGGSAGKG